MSGWCRRWRGFSFASIQMWHTHMAFCFLAYSFCSSTTLSSHCFYFSLILNLASFICLITSFVFILLWLTHYLQRHTSCLFCRKKVAGWIHLFVSVSRFSSHWCGFINIYRKMCWTKKKQDKLFCVCHHHFNCFGTLTTPPVYFSCAIMSFSLIMKVLITSVEHKSRLRHPVGMAAAGIWWAAEAQENRTPPQDV